MVTLPTEVTTAEPKASPPPPVISMDRAVRAIGHPLRWRLLAELAKGEPLMLTELAGRVGRSAANVSKQLGFLRSLGVVAVTRRLHHISPRLPQSGNGEVDFGWFVARFGTRS